MARDTSADTWRQLHTWPGPMFTWHHAHLRCTDPELAAQWFVDHLGASRLPGGGGPSLKVELGGTRIFFAPATGPGPGSGSDSDSGSETAGIHHLCFRVRDLDAVAEHLRAAGVRFPKEPASSRPGVHVCFVEGPDGILIELLQTHED